MFPKNIKLEDVRESIKGRNEFREMVTKDHIVFTYFLGQSEDDNMFPDPSTAPDERTEYLWKVRRECRGIVFNKDTEKIISRRFHKFFNIGELPETSIEKIDFNRNYFLLVKLDGSMIAPFFTEGKLRYATKQTVTDTSLLVEEFVKKSGINFDDFCTNWIEKGYSPIFEWCSR